MRFVYSKLDFIFLRKDGSSLCTWHDDLYKVFISVEALP